MPRLLDAPPHCLALADAAPRGEGWLDPAERRRATTLPPSAQADWRAGRAALRRALIGGAALGAPVMSASVSHRAGHAAAVASVQGAWGIDLEVAGTVPDPRRRYFLDAAERHAFAALDATTCWTLKEAAWKALRLTASRPFHALALCGTGGVLEAVELDGRRLPASAAMTRPWPGFVLAIVCVRTELVA